jgi:hypothetical protein
VLARLQQFRPYCHGVFAEQRGENIGKHRLAIASIAVEKKQLLFRYRSGQGVADGAMDEGNGGVVAKCAGQEVVPERALGVRVEVYARLLRYSEDRVGGAKLARSTTPLGTPSSQGSASNAAELDTDIPGAD